MPREIKEVKTDLLKPHPQNERIYGQEDVSDLVSLITERGRIVDNLVVNKSNVIISGHRRWLAAKELGLQTVPCEIVDFASPEEELEELIHYNAGREKTFEQKIRESMTLEEIYSAKAEKRSMSNLKNVGVDKVKLATSTEMDENSEEYADDEVRGATRDIVAKKAGISSGKTYERGKKVVLEVDKLRSVGKEDDAELLITVLNKSASAAEDLATKIDLGSLSEEEKDCLRQGRASVRSLVPKEVERETSAKPKTEYALAKEQTKMILSTQGKRCAPC